MKGEPTEETRQVLVEYRLGQVERALKQGANTFSKIRASVFGAVVASLAAAGGMIWDLARSSDDAEEVAAEVQSLLTKQDEANERERDFTIRLNGLEAALRQERERREALERALQERTPARRGRP